MKWTIFLSFTLILSLTCTIQGIECLKIYLIDADTLRTFTATLHSNKDWWIPHELQVLTFYDVLQQSLGLSIKADLSIFQEYNQLISLIGEFDTNNLNINEQKLQESLLRLQDFQLIVNLIVIIVIVAQIVILLQFIIAIMADSQSKVSSDFTMYSQRLKATHMLQWHWCIDMHFSCHSQDSLQVKPWKVCLLNGGDSQWKGHSQVIKKYISETIEHAGDSITEVGHVCADLGKKGDEVHDRINKFKGELVTELVNMIKNKNSDQKTGGDNNFKALAGLKSKKKV